MAMGYTHHRTCYTRVRKPCIAGAGGGYYKGFRLNSRRFSVHRLRAKFFHLFRLLSRLKALYFRAVRALMKRSITGGKVGGRNLGITREINYALYGNNGGGEVRLKSSFSRSNSFYAEAIADCLDFIHRNSLSMEEKPVLIRQN
nr:hypothetical protein A4A49_41782 [Ipomoea batatas]